MYATWHQDPLLVMAARRFVPGAGPGAASCGSASIVDGRLGIFLTMAFASVLF